MDMTYHLNDKDVHHGRLTWNLRIQVWKRGIIWTKPSCLGFMLMEKIPNNHLECIKPYALWMLGYLLHQLVVDVWTINMYATHIFVVGSDPKGSEDRSCGFLLDNCAIKMNAAFRHVGDAFPELPKLGDYLEARVLLMGRRWYVSSMCEDIHERPQRFPMLWTGSIQVVEAWFSDFFPLK